MARPRREQSGWRAWTREPLHALGEDPDPRFTFANERTFLAWNRTALALIGGGLAVAQLLEIGGPVARLAIAMPLMGLGSAIAVLSYSRWAASERAMRLGQPLPRSRLPLLLLAGGFGAVGVVAAVIAVGQALA